ncbi:MAG: enoyl-ACP reductase [bacterium]|nr:enoyl-ACP reductase [bacterium]
MHPIDLNGKVALVMGIANKRSIAWGIAQALAKAGATVVLTYQTKRFKKNLKDLVAEAQFQKYILVKCDVTIARDIQNLFRVIKERIGYVDFLVHSLAFAPSSALDNGFLKTTRKDFAATFAVSVYSLIALSREFAKLARENSSIVAMTFEGSQRVFSGYNIMGPAKAALEASVRELSVALAPSIRVNAISAGPVNTLAARGISEFQSKLAAHRAKAPLGRNVSPLEIGNTALFLCSHLSEGITGQTIFVDAGYNIVGV